MKRKYTAIEKLNSKQLGNPKRVTHTHTHTCGLCCGCCRKGQNAIPQSVCEMFHTVSVCIAGDNLLMKSPHPREEEEHQNV